MQLRDISTSEEDVALDREHLFILLQTWNDYRFTVIGETNLIDTIIRLLVLNVQWLMGEVPMAH